VKTIRYKGTEIHVGCEGTVVKGVCLRCGERKKSRLQKWMGDEPTITTKPKFDPEAHKRRIRNMEDI
jgi:hypothetical protein